MTALIPEEKKTSESYCFVTVSMDLIVPEDGGLVLFLQVCIIKQSQVMLHLMLLYGKDLLLA